MSLTDDQFREEYKPIYVPSHFDAADTQQNKMIFALAQIGEGTEDDVIAELQKLQPDTALTEQNTAFVRATLANLYEHGHITGSEKDGRLHFNLSKITRANDGQTNPDLLAPGLD